MDRGRDRLVLWILLAHLPLGLLVAFLSETASIMHAVGEMAIVPVLAGIAYWQLAGRRVDGAWRRAGRGGNDPGGRGRAGARRDPPGCGDDGQAIEEIAVVASDTTAATGEVSTATADTSARVGEMRSRASALAATAEQLRALVGRFKLRDEGRGARGEGPRDRAGRLAA